MKTLHLLLGLIILASVPFGCETDSIKIENRIDEIESGEMLVELRIEEYALNIEAYNLEQNIETEEDKIRYDFIQERLKVIKQGIVMLEIGPIPPPRPCADEPANCPIPIGILKKILVQEKLDAFEIVVRDPQTQEVLYVVEEFNESDLGEGLLEYNVEVEKIGSDQLVIMEVIKKSEDQDLSYQVFADPTK